VLKSNDWQPSASIDVLKQRAAILSTIRDFFKARGVTEVDTPLLCRATVTDPFLHSLKLTFQNEDWYLQTSPEYTMKRLLAAGSGPIYQICKAFRADESGRYHNPEFTMLEWYRPSFDHHALMDEMDELLQLILQCKPAQRFSYADLFQEFLQLDPHQSTKETLQTIAQQHHLEIVGDNLDKDDWLQLLMAHLIEPKIDSAAPTFVYDFPATQAALAKIRQEAIPVAERFEVYIQGIELANGFHELADSQEQRFRFEKDLTKRKMLNYSAVPIDEYLLASLQHFPPCSGVALGIDRLMMLALQKKQISEVLSFTCKRV
jgi:elongation factor P--(R)-beta-lysine ligase